MGGGSSTSSDVTSINTSVTNAMAQAIMNCSGNTMTEQKFTVSGSYNAINNFKMVQAMSLSATCANNADNLASVQAAVTAAVTAAASSQSVAGLGSLTKSDAQVKVRIQNDVTQNITSQTITNVINTVNAVQTATISGDNNIISNFDEEQTLVIVQNACQAVVSKMSTVQEIKSSAEAKSEAKQTDPIDSFMKNINSIVGTGFAGANTGFGIVAAVAITCIIGGVILVNKFGGKIIDKMPTANLTGIFKNIGKNPPPRRKSISKSSPKPKLKRSLSAPPVTSQVQPSAPQSTDNLPNLSFTKAATDAYVVGQPPAAPQQQPIQQQQPVQQPQPTAQPAPVYLSGLLPQPTSEQVDKLLSSARDIYKNDRYKFGKPEDEKYKNGFQCNKCKCFSTAEFGWFYNSETDENFHFNNGNIPCFQEYLKAESHIEVYRPSPPDQKQQLDQQPASQFQQQQPASQFQQQQPASQFQQKQPTAQFQQKQPTAQFQQPPFNNSQAGALQSTYYQSR